MELSFPQPITTRIQNSEFWSLEILVRSRLLRNSFSVGIYQNSRNRNRKTEITAFGTGDWKPECTTKLCAHYDEVMAEDLISLTTEWNGCKLKKASNDPKLWYAELECLWTLIEKAGALRKTDVEVVAFIMSQIPAEYDIRVGHYMEKKLFFT